MSTDEAAESATKTTDEIEIRALGEDEVGVWGAAVNTGFLLTGQPDGAEYRRLRHYPGRMVGAFDGGRCVGTFRSMPFELTLPGGALLPVSAITGVTVTQTHKRRGLLSRMMARDLAASRDRGEAVAILIAAEYAIYGRFGFGPATEHHGWLVDLRRSGGIRTDLPASFAAVGGRLDLVDMTELAKIGPELHERWRRGRPGAISRDEAYWGAATGQLKPPGHSWKEPFAVVHRDAAGVVTGLATYQVEDHWDGSYPDCTLKVRDLLALDRATEVSLWRYLCSVDWVSKVQAPNVGPDSPLPLLLVDPRGTKPYEENTDFTWLRVLDLPAAFAARRYAGAGRVVLEVTDPAGYVAGRWALTADAEGAGQAVETADEPDLALDARALGTLYLGAESASRLAAGGLVEELRPGAAFALDRLLSTPLKAWNPDSF
ncbi:GNAT family N-acetyltransferase [Kitasatospora sp. NBC_01287]|uniref:GNAT family N-acetyltransferase n=1 Tax=Kitasatospora sp. NBC_01287 TaxID=2903573 RepID=UPI002250F72A|nr:GNAT family N-acetyltransferase [Kitasatospora sp. NBC_01287]MCX4748193.1 GNAT family N-acetyltransferase [Kitasatospora sp. NBC_01287]